MSAIDRILASLEKLTLLFTRRLPAAFLWRYSVEEASETSFSGKRLSPDCPFDDMPNIPLFPGIAGAGVKPAIGSVALVAFLDGNPNAPVVVGWDQAVPQSVTVDATDKIRVGPSVAAVEIAGAGKPAVHRVNDTGTAGSLTAASALMTLVDASGNTTTYAFAIPTGVVTITQVGTGAIGTKATTGSAKVTCG